MFTNMAQLFANCQYMCAKSKFKGL